MHKFGLISPLNIEAGKHMNIEVVSGKVIGEFVCDSVFPLSFYASDASFFDTEPPLPVPGTCLTDREIADYLGNGKTGYGWHISELWIYDKPKELKQFQIPTTIPARRVRQAPQSWCYIEEVE
jgi:hypothetical protein